MSLLAVTALLAAGCNRSTPSNPATTRTPPATGIEAPPQLTINIPALVRQTEPSVVTILTNSGLGSGIVYRKDGTVVTAAHVVGNNNDVKVAFADGQQFGAHVNARDPVSDVAVLKADRAGVTPAKFQQALPQVGEPVVAIGSPLGFEATVTSGIISGLHRQIPGSAAAGQPLVDLIQTDAPISPGNSGGALINATGEVVGVNEAYLPPATGAVSLGFATPSGDVVQVADELLSTGKARHSFVGIQPATLTSEIAGQLGINRDRGVIVQEVVPDSPAAQAGIQPGDVITAINGTETTTAENFIAELRKTKPGDRIELTVVRGGKTARIPVTVADRPPA
jgi:S1-C subfamily serine protease